MKKTFSMLLSLAAVNFLYADNDIFSYEGEIRAGYIYVDNKKEIDTKALGVGGHLDLKTKEYNGLIAKLSFYTLQDFGMNPSNKDEINEDFYGPKKDGLTFISEAYIDYNYKNLEFKAGRFSIDTPHADSDDIRMVPNFFEGYNLNAELGDFGLTFIHLNKMAGWENGSDIKKFVNLNEVMEIEDKTDGMSAASIEYEKDGFSASVWAYKIYDVANILYFETSYGFDIDNIGLNFAFQFDKAKDCGKSYKDDIDSKTFGFLAEANIKDFTINAAYNKESGDTGSMFSFGGGPFFTSMEDQTIDSVEDKDAKSYVFGAEYSFSENYSFGAMYGKFEAGDKNNYETEEVDLYLNAKLIADIEGEIVYANIDDKTSNNEDYNIFRVRFIKSF